MTQIIALIGAKTLLGQEILQIMSENNIQADQIKPLATQKDIGKEISFGDDIITTLDFNDFDMNGADVIIYADTIYHAPHFFDDNMTLKAKIIDLSGYLYEQNSDVPSHYVALPSMRCAPIIDVLSYLCDQGVITSITMTGMESTSTQGKDGMDELFNQSRKFFMNDDDNNHVYERQIAFNVIPAIDGIDKDGHTDAETQTHKQIAKSLQNDSIEINSTFVSVPVFIGNSTAMTVTFDKDVSAKDIRTLLAEDDHVMLIDKESDMQFVSPTDIAGEDALFISRVRNNQNNNTTLSLWCCVDPVRYMAKKLMPFL